MRRYESGARRPSAVSLVDSIELDDLEVSAQCEIGSEDVADGRDGEFTATAAGRED